MSDFKWPAKYATDDGVVISLLVLGHPTLHYFKGPYPDADVIEATRQSLEALQLVTRRSRDYREMRKYHANS